MRGTLFIFIMYIPRVKNFYMASTLTTLSLFSVTQYVPVEATVIHKHIFVSNVTKIVILYTLHYPADI